MVKIWLTISWEYGNADIVIARSKIMMDSYCVINVKNGGKSHGLELGKACLT